MSDAPDRSEEETRHRRGLKFRRRDDYAVELFQEALAGLADPARVDRILVELGRFYNPYVNAPIVDLATRRGVLEALAAGNREAADHLLRERMKLYTSPGDPGPA